MAKRKPIKKHKLNKKEFLKEISTPIIAALIVSGLIGLGMDKAWTISTQKPNTEITKESN